MYIGLKQIQNQLTDYQTLLTSSDGIHALTGWSKLQDAPQPLTIHLLYTCVYTPQLLSYPFIPDMHLLCIVPDNINRRLQPVIKSQKVKQCGTVISDPALDVVIILQESIEFFRMITLYK